MHIYAHISKQQAIQLDAIFAFTQDQQRRRSRECNHGLSDLIADWDHETQTTKHDKKGKIKKEEPEHKKIPTSNFSVTFSQSIRKRQ